MPFKIHLIFPPGARRAFLVLIMSAGMTLDARAQFLFEYKTKERKAEVLILMDKKQLSKDLVSTGKIKGEDVVNVDDASFRKQLKRFVRMALDENSNVILLDDIVNDPETEQYAFKGKGYRTDDLQNLKASFPALQDFVRDKADSSITLVVYRAPNASREPHMKLRINRYLTPVRDNETIRFKNDTILYIKKDDTDVAQKLELKRGNRYYLRCVVYNDTNGGGTVRKYYLVEPEQGELESGLNK